MLRLGARFIERPFGDLETMPDMKKPFFANKPTRDESEARPERRVPSASTRGIGRAVES